MFLLFLLTKTKDSTAFLFNISFELYYSFALNDFSAWHLLVSTLYSYYLLIAYEQWNSPNEARTNPHV